MRTLILDDEAVDALRDVTHPHHRTAMAYYEANRSTRRRDPARRTIVPTSVRVEAGWDRTAPTSAFVDRLRIEDAPLDPAAADSAAALCSATGTSVADAHLGATIVACGGDEVTVLTSDPGDVAKVATSRPVTIVAL